jgi:hypothetical protein
VLRALCILPLEEQRRRSITEPVAHRVCLMCGHAAQSQKWLDHFRLIVRGPSARLLAAGKDLQAKVMSVMQNGVQVQACMVCADSYRPGEPPSFDSGGSRLGRDASPCPAKIANNIVCTARRVTNCVASATPKLMVRAG